MQWGRLGTQRGLRAAGDNRLGGKMGGRLEGGRGKGPAGFRQPRDGLETSGKRTNQLRPKGWGNAWVRVRAADGGPRGGFRVGSGPHLKSLSLDVIFSSKLEMWYEALAMLTASIPLAAAAAAPGAPPLVRGGSHFQGRRARPTLTKEEPGLAAPCPAKRGPVPEEAEATARPNEGVARWRTSSWAARSTAESPPGARHLHSVRFAPTPSALAPQGKRPRPASFAQGVRRGRRGTLQKTEVRVHGGLPTPTVETLTKEQFCWLRFVSVLV